jgi:hypothetical protein
METSRRPAALGTGFGRCATKGWAEQRRTGGAWGDWQELCGGTGPAQGIGWQCTRLGTEEGRPATQHPLPLAPLVVEQVEGCIFLVGCRYRGRPTSWQCMLTAPLFLRQGGGGGDAGMMTMEGTVDKTALLLALTTAAAAVAWQQIYSGTMAVATVMSITQGACATPHCGSRV